MNKTFAFRLIMGLSLLAAATLWLLSVIPATAESFGFERGSVGQWVGVIIAFGWGLAFILRGIIVKNSVPLIQRLQVIFGIALAAVGVLILVEIFTWETPVMPIVAVAVAFALLLSLIITGGRRWDTADNEKRNSQPARPKTEWEKRQEQNARDAAARAGTANAATDNTANNNVVAVNQEAPAASESQPGSTTTVVTTVTTTTTTPNNSGENTENN